MSRDVVEIRPFRPGLEAEVLELIVGIQRGEFGIDITPEEQPDLREIPAFYQVRDGGFWVALADGRVVGTIALLDIGNRQGALRKMFVHRDHRGREAGPAQLLLDALLGWARAREIREILLGTTAKFLAAHRFYEKNGFEEIAKADLPPAFPIMAVDTKFYRRRVEPDVRAYEGGCTCRFVRYRMASPPMFVHCCHCRWCQRETGSAFVLNALIEADRVQLLQGDVELVLTPSQSGAGQKIARCPRCHVAVWSHYAFGKIGDAVRFVRVGTLDEPDRLPPDIHIFTSSKQPWVVLPPDAPAVAGYYETSERWPKQSLERRDVLIRGNT